MSNRAYGCATSGWKTLLRLVRYCFFACYFLLAAIYTHADTQVELNETFAGNIDFALAGGSLRRSDDECQMVQGGMSEDTVQLPANATIEAAFIYWAGNGSVDSQVTLNGRSIRATLGNYHTVETDNNRTYFAGKADVTEYVSNSTSTNYTFSGLTFETGQNSRYCDNATVFGGWALVIVYEAPAEPLRVVNIFDGFQTFWGSSITLTPNNFVVDNNPGQKQGHHAHITWEGDDGNSQTRNGVREDLFFNGNELTDSNNPSRNQFNSRSNEIGSTSGVDIDSYQIGNYLSANQTSATTVYSTGQDRVFLSAEIISIPNQPVSDLTIIDDGDVGAVRGTDATFVMNIVNNGPSEAVGGGTVEIDLEDNVSYEGFSGTNWQCHAATSSTVSCVYSGSIGDEELSEDLLLTLGTAATTLDEIDMTATVSTASGEFDNNAWNNETTLRLTIGTADLTTSVKNVEFSTLGETLHPGDTLTYTINLNNTGNSSTIATLVDHLPTGIDSFSVITVPSGASLQTHGAPDGDHGAGYFELTDVFVPANSSVAITLDAVVSTAAQSGDTFTNTAVVTDSNLNSTNITSETVTVGQAFSTEGNKPLYLHMSNNSADLTLSRMSEEASGAPDYFTIDSGTTAVWTLTPAVQTNLSLDYSEDIFSEFYVKMDCRNGMRRVDNFEVELVNASQGQTIAAYQVSFTGYWSELRCRSIYRFSYPLEIINQASINAGDSLQLHISLDAEDDMRIYANQSNTRARIELNSNTIININSILAYDAPYPNGTATTQVTEGSEAYLRIVVSDPFGFEDITEARITSIRTPAGDELLPSFGGTEPSPVLLDPIISSGAFKTYQYPPADEPGMEFPDGEEWIGQWRITIEADEGYEGIVMAKRTVIINVTGRPEPELIKTTETIWDPVNGTNNPKAIPGADVMYTLTIRNPGDGSITNNSIVIVDVIDSELVFIADDFTNTTNPGNSGPIIFTDGDSTPSGLTFNFTALDDLTDDVDFSTDGTNFDYVPQPDARGIDEAITHIRLNPRGVMSAADGTDIPEFKLQYQVRVE